jgi:hypothetical protein
MGFKEIIIGQELTIAQWIGIPFITAMWIWGVWMCFNEPSMIPDRWFWMCVISIISLVCFQILRFIK